MNKQDKQNELEVANNYLAKLHKLRDFIWSYFDKTDEIYNPLLRLTEEAIADKIDDIAILRGCKLVKTNKRKKYVFEVGRERIGGADVYLNGEKIWTFIDEVIKVDKGDKVFTDIVKGVGSRIPDAAFIKALFFTPSGELSDLSDKVREIFDRDIPREILDEQKRNTQKNKEKALFKENNKTTTKKVQNQILAGVLKILRSAKREIYNKALRTEDGAQIITDGVRAVKLYSPLDLPTFADGYEAESYANSIDKIIKNASHNSGITIMPKSVQELRKLISEQKLLYKEKNDKSQIVPLDITPDIRLDACKLVDLLRVLPDAVLIVSSNKIDTWRRPVYLKAENGCGIILPVYKGNNL